MRVLVAVLFSVQVFAATAYDVRKHEGPDLDAATVIVEGSQYRADLATRADEAILYTSVLWTGGAKATALNARNATWYELTPEPLAVRSFYLNPLMNGEVKKVRWTMSEKDGTYTARLTYDVVASMGGTRVKVSCTADYVVETTDQHPRGLWLGRIFANTRLLEVDAQLAAGDQTITRFPIRIRLTATRRYEGGPPMQDVVVIEVHDVRTVKTDPKMFVRPADYRHQEPVIGVPGVG
ncbi:MAG TPA: hypothetical protein VNI54_07460 [Thermoanaerobaculia bacterium]|nr:hypothetical protein [Thermoanaerobaculia bacterium]